MYPAILSFMAMLGAAVVTSSDVSYVRLETSDTTIQAGEQFSVQVFAFAHVPVNAIDITLQFDSKSFEVLGVDRGQSVLTIWTRDPVIENGRVLLQGGTFRKGFLDEHLIATINLKAKETGQSTFEATDVVLLAGDGSGSQISVAKSLDSKVSLFVYDENTSPESIGANVTIDLITDLDGDGKVTLKDISTFMAAWHNKDNMYDFNGDGRMTFRDFSIILSNFFF
ncbi:hypothetical protein KC730_01605 [Candidatus Kaiserbacteria bacterium]|nr:hypothetical protein [Candidatus Kaiserbacteria bacterium]